MGFDSYFEDAGSSVSTLSFASNAGNITGTVANTANRVLIIAFISRVNPGTITSVPSWNGVAGTLITSANTGSLGYIYFYGLKGDGNVATGNNTLACTWTNSSVASLMAWSFNGVDTTTGWGNTGNHSATDTSLTVTVTTTSGNFVCVAAFDDDSSSGTFSAGGTSFVSDVRDGRFTGNYHGAHCTANSSSTTVTGTLGSSKLHIEVAVEVIAAASLTTEYVAPMNALGTSAMIGRRYV